MRIVHNKSIPNVDADRLRDSLLQIHQQYHTIEGLQKFDAPRRKLVDIGKKGLLIKDELVKRNEPTGIYNCRWCSV